MVRFVNATYFCSCLCVCMRAYVCACGVACCSSCVSLFMRACACLLFPAFLLADGRVLHLVNQVQQQSSTDRNDDGTVSVNASPISQSPAVLQPQAETSLPSFSRPFHAIPLGLPAWASFTAVAVGMSHCLAITGEVGYSKGRFLGLRQKLRGLPSACEGVSIRP